MSKKENPSRTKENEAIAVARMLKVSPQKLNIVASLIRGKKASSALNILAFSKRRIAVDVKKALQSAIANAENNKSLNVDQLIVSQAYVGKSITLKRGTPRGRGKYSKILKPFSQITIHVIEQEAS